MDIVVRWQATPSAPIDQDRPQSTSREDVIPVLDPGAGLEAGGVYLDLANPARGPFRALAGQIAGTGNRYVAQRDVSCETWCDLVRAAADAAFDGLHDIDCSGLAGEAMILPWPQPATDQAQAVATP